MTVEYMKLWQPPRATPKANRTLLKDMYPVISFACFGFVIL